MGQFHLWFCATMVLALFPNSLSAAFEWITIPSALTRIEGQSMTLTWTVNITSHTPLTVKVWQRKNGADFDVLFYYNGSVEARGAYVNRSADVNLIVHLHESMLNVTLYMFNLVKSADESEYDATITLKNGDFQTAPNTTSLTILVPPSITNSPSYTISTIEGQTVQLMCNATGFPTPTVNWTRNDVSIGSGNPIQIQATSQDHNRCYTCVVFNGVYNAKTANVCLTVQYKFNWTSTPSSSLTILYGQNLTLTWNVDLSPSIAFQSATVWQTKGNNRNPVISYYVNGSTVIYDQTFKNRSADLALTAIQSGSIVSIRFEYAYLIKSTDEGAYDVSVTAASGNTDVSPNKTNVTINDREIWMTYPPSLTRIQGQSMTLIWKGNFPYQKFLFAKVWISKNGKKEDVAFYKAENGTAEARGSYINRSAHISLTVSQIRSVVIVTFVLENLLKNTDEGAFDLTLTLSGNTIIAPKTPLMINVPPDITSFHPYTLSTIESQNVDLMCNATGFPTPTVNWTRNGVLVGTGSPLSIRATPQDHNRCYTCVVFNGVYDAKTANVCLSVEFRPIGPHQFTVDRSTVCQKNMVNMTCQSGPANPPSSVYAFYYNGVFLKNSSSKVLVTNLTSVAAPKVNQFTCVPANRLGGTSQNVTVDVIAKVPPAVTQTTNDSIVVEGSNLTLTCNVSGTPPLNVTWKKDSKLDFQGNVYVLTNIKRGDAGAYHCSVTNGPECPSNSATVNVTVKYSPIILNGNATFSAKIGERARLLCDAIGVPTPSINWTRNGTVLYTGNPYITPLLTKSDDDTSYTCLAFNEIGVNSSNLFLSLYTEVNITTPYPQIITVNESNSAKLICGATGRPTPTINWTRDGVILYTGSPFITSLLSHNDDNACYTCIAYNGIGDAKTANYCLNVQYAPRNASLIIDRKTVCQNDTVNMTCHSGPANPASYKYNFYHNNVLVQSSPSNIYVAKASYGLPETNMFTCLSINLLGNGVQNASSTVSAKVAPHFSRMNNPVVVEGSRLNLTCDVSGTPPPAVTWKRDGKEDVQGKVYSLNNVTRHDNGAYLCVVDNGSECPSKSAIINVTVLYEPESIQFNIEPSLKRFCKGNTTVISCNATAKPPAEYSLYHNGRLVQSRSPTGRFIVSMNEKGDNYYTCVPNNTAGIGPNKTIHAFVVDPPAIVMSPQSSTIEEGQRLTLFCNASGLPQPNITWHKGDGGIIIQYGNTLSINNLRRENEGSYRCVAKNGEECNTASAVAVVTVNYPPVITTPNPKLTVNESNPVQMFCNATGKPSPSIVWLRDGIAIPSNGGLLTTPPLNHSDNDACYTCVAQNGIGVGSSKKFCLNVLYKPRNTALLIHRSKLCQNETVNMTCQSYSANPPSLSYRFFYNNVPMQDSSSNVFITNATLVSPDVNRFTCIPRNLLGDALKNASTDVIAKAPPKITEITNNLVVVEGAHVNLSCAVSGTTPITTTWTRIGKADFQGNAYSLFNINRSDNGAYLCTVTNGAECPSTSAIVNVTVNYKPESTQFNISPNRRLFCKESNVTFRCSASAKPGAVEYSLYRNKYLEQRRSETGIFIIQLNESGENMFTCVPNNTVGEGLNRTIQLSVADNFSIVVSPLNVSVVEGKNLTLHCNVSGHPAPNITWTKLNGTIVGYGDTLDLNGVNRDHEGFYRCAVINGVECSNETAVASVTINYMATITEPPPRNVTLYHNNQLKLTCKVDGNPFPNITWIRNDNPSIIGRGSNLQLKPADSLSGKYTCSVSNGIGSVKTATSYVMVAACQSHKCQNGRCVTLGTTYSCQCETEFNGQYCETHVCKNHLCKYNTECVSTPSSYRCLCLRGLKGIYCDTEDPLHNSFLVTVTIESPEWVPEYEDSKSKEFESLENKICSNMFSIFKNDLIKCKVISLRKGSIVSQTELTFNATKTESEVLKSLNSKTTDNKLGDIELKPSSLQVKVYSNPCTKEPCKFDGECQVQSNGFTCVCKSFRYGETCEKGIGIVPGIIAIFAAVLVLLFAIFLFLIYFCSKRRETDSKDGPDYDLTMTPIRYNTSCDMHKMSRQNHIYYGDELEEPAIFEKKEIENGHIEGSASEQDPSELCYRV